MKKQDTNTLWMKNATLYGYILFGIIVASQVFNTFVAYLDLQTNHIPSTDNGLLVFAMGILAELLPPVIAYVVGVSATKSTLRYERRYNGVLFGLAAFWLWSLLVTASTFVLFPIDTYYYLQFGASLTAVLMMIGLGVWYARCRKQVQLDRFKPYQFVLIGSILALFLLTFTYVFGGGPSTDTTMTALIAALYWALIITPPAGTYYLLRRDKLPGLVRLTRTAIVATIVFLTATIIGQTLSFMRIEPAIATALSITCGLAVWLLQLKAYKLIGK